MLSSVVSRSNPMLLSLLTSDSSVPSKVWDVAAQLVVLAVVEQDPGLSLLKRG